METDNDLPITLKERLLALASHLPQNSRKPFLKSVSARLQKLSLDYENTLFWGVAGWLIGEVIDQCLTIGTPFSDATWCLTGDHGSLLGGIAGATFGFLQDKKKAAAAKAVSEVIREELAVALAGA